MFCTPETDYFSASKKACCEVEKGRVARQKIGFLRPINCTCCEAETGAYCEAENSALLRSEKNGLVTPQINWIQK